MTSPIASLLPLILMQVGPNPSAGAIPDYSAEVQDRPARSAPAPADPAAELVAADDGWLQNCLDLVDSDPARAHVQAQLRRDQTEAEDQVIANYCLGMAASALELWEDARTGFVGARDGTGPEDGSLRARLGTMAGNAALAGQDTAGALALLEQAQRDAEAASAWTLAGIAAIDRARVLVASGEEAGGLAALADARRLDAESGEAWLLSATLMRRMERLEEAQAMIERAGELDEANPDVALEAGVIAVLSGRDEAARASWDSVVALAPESPQADTARGYLAQLGEAVPTP